MEYSHPSSVDAGNVVSIRHIYLHCIPNAAVSHINTYSIVKKHVDDIPSSPVWFPSHVDDIPSSPDWFPSHVDDIPSSPDWFPSHVTFCVVVVVFRLCTRRL